MYVKYLPTTFKYDQYSVHTTKISNLFFDELVVAFLYKCKNHFERGTSMI